MDKIWSESIDYGAMFDGEVGVYKSEGYYFAYAKDGWGAGMKCGRKSLDEANKEIERLTEKMFG